ncbi:aryl-sulfate sulfotransferase [bacterium]|nr:aryl-sulfate sulfotransferase [bacterium]
MRIQIILLLMLSAITRAGTYHQAIDYFFPLPGSKLLPVKTTVILKLDTTYNGLITDLSNLITVKDGAIGRPGNTFFATDNRTIIFKPNNDFQKGRTITVTVQLSQFGLGDFKYDFTIVKNSDNDLDWLSKTNTATDPSINDIQDFSPVRLINGVAVPSDFPEIDVNIIGETAPGRIFIPATEWIIICDNDGTPYFYRKYEDGHTRMRFEAHPSGDLSFHSFEVYDVIMDRNFVEVDTILPGHGYMPDDHELQILENGHLLLVGRDDVRIDMSKIVSGGNDNALVEAHHFQEMDRDHNVIFEWRNWDHLDIRETGVSLRGGFIDFVHTNSLAIDYDGHYIISPREYDMIMKIDRISGETIWTLGGNHSDFVFINEDIRFSRIHDVRPVPGKPNQYTLYDNGRERGDGTHFSRAVEYKLDPDAMTAEKVWEYRHTPDLFSAYCGSCQPLENGNRLIGWAENNTFSEVDSNGELVWEMVVSGFSCSRCRRCEWEGMMLQPYLIAENMGAVVRLIFNKFGDPDVDHYNIYSGKSANSLALFDTTGQTYYDMDATLLDDGTQYYFRVTAVNQNGEESEFSQLESARINTVAPGENAIQNGGFQSVNGWILQTIGNALASGQVNTEGFYQVLILQGGIDMRQIQLKQNDLLVIKNKNYIFSFDAYATKNKVIEAKIESANSPNTDYSKAGYTAVTTRLNHYEYDFFMESNTDAEARVVFNCGGDGGTVFIDNVSLKYDSENNISTPGDNGQPQTYALYPAYPNPFNPVTNIQYQIPKDSHVCLKIFNSLGQEVATLVDSEKKAGTHSVAWNAENNPTGLYFVSMETETFEQINKIMLIR